MSHLLVVGCGPQCSIQDGGRPGVGRMGLAFAGAMDQRALSCANALVGNRHDAPAVEMLFTGGRFRAVGGAMRVAIAGAPASVTVDGRSRRHHCSIFLTAGEQLDIGRTKRGVYTMLAVAGGFDVPLVLGSCALDARAELGGLGGRTLAAGDHLHIAGAPAWRGPERRTPPVSLDPDAAIRVVMGPQDDAFTPASIEAFLHSSFRVSHQTSRMAYRLEGPPLLRRHANDMISDATLPGSIQVPPDGAPLVLMADRQTIGGYPKIATVIGADLSRLAQRRPQEVVRFRAVSPREAVEIARQSRLSEIVVEPAPPSESASVTRLDAQKIEALCDAVVDAHDARSWDLGAEPRR